jgi:hypothetical protein
VGGWEDGILMANDLHLGELIKDENPQRDAIHVAVAPAIAAERLNPGQHVGFSGSLVGRVASPIGIVDPFLKDPVPEGTRFWLFLYPGSITSLRHDWTHPAFETQPLSRIDELRLSSSREWLKNFARDVAECPYEDLLLGIDPSTRYELGGTPWSTGFDVPAGLWGHYEIVTGNNIPPADREWYFSCSC